MVRWLFVIAFVFLTGCAANRPVMPESGFMAGNIKFTSAKHNPICLPNSECYYANNYVVSLQKADTTNYISDSEAFTDGYNEEIIKKINSSASDSGKWKYFANGYVSSDKGFMAHNSFFRNKNNWYLLSVICTPTSQLSCKYDETVSTVYDIKAMLKH